MTLEKHGGDLFIFFLCIFATYYGYSNVVLSYDVKSLCFITTTTFNILCHDTNIIYCHLLWHFNSLELNINMVIIRNLSNFLLFERLFACKVNGNIFFFPQRCIFPMLNIFYQIKKIICIQKENHFFWLFL